MNIQVHSAVSNSVHPECKWRLWNIWPSPLDVRNQRTLRFQPYSGEPANGPLSHRKVKLTFSYPFSAKSFSSLLFYPFQRLSGSVLVSVAMIRIFMQFSSKIPYYLVKFVTFIHGLFWWIHSIYKAGPLPNQEVCAQKTRNTHGIKEGMKELWINVM